MIHFLVHEAADNVGVAVVDLEAGTKCIGRNLADNSTLHGAHRTVDSSRTQAGPEGPRSGRHGDQIWMRDRTHRSAREGRTARAYTQSQDEEVGVVP